MDHARDPPTLGRVAQLHGQLQVLETHADDLDFTCVRGTAALPCLRRRRKGIVEECGGLLQALEDLQASLQGDAFMVHPGNTEGGTAIHGPENEVHCFLTQRDVQA